MAETDWVVVKCCWAGIFHRKIKGWHVSHWKWSLLLCWWVDWASGNSRVYQKCALKEKKGNRNYSGNSIRMYHLGASHWKSWEYPFALLGWCGGQKIMKMTIFLSFIFVLTLKFPQISQNSAKSCVVLLQKEQIFVLENHDLCKNKLKY